MLTIKELVTELAAVQKVFDPLNAALLEVVPGHGEEAILERDATPLRRKISGLSHTLSHLDATTPEDALALALVALDYAAHDEDAGGASDGSGSHHAAMRGLVKYLAAMAGRRPEDLEIFRPAWELSNRLADQSDAELPASDAEQPGVSLFQQARELLDREKAANPVAVPVGQFCEFFLEDAEAVSHTLEIALTLRSRDAAVPVPICGVPCADRQRYFARLAHHGFKVVVANVPLADGEFIALDSVELAALAATIAELTVAHEALEAKIFALPQDDPDYEVLSERCEGLNSTIGELENDIARRTPSTDRDAAVLSILLMSFLDTAMGGPLTGEQSAMERGVHYIAENLSSYLLARAGTSREDLRMSARYGGSEKHGAKFDGGPFAFNAPAIAQPQAV